MMPHLLEAQIITGQGKGETVLITLIPPVLPLEFCHLQFIARVSFATFINKAQGQPLKVTGLNLLQPYFSHGYLYDGCSRIGNGNELQTRMLCILELCVKITLLNRKMLIFLSIIDCNKIISLFQNSSFMYIGH